MAKGMQEAREGGGRAAAALMGTLIGALLACGMSLASPRPQAAVGGGDARAQEAQVPAPEGAAAAAAASSASTPAAAAASSTRRCVHTVLTSNGTPYMNWQTRVMYASYKQAAARSEGLMAAFTRVLHRVTPDELMTEVPTWRVDPLHVDCDEYCPYPVADRAAAVALWLHEAESATCEYLMLVETDYLYARPLREADLPAPGRGRAFSFGYVQPTNGGLRDIMEKLMPAAKFGPPSGVPRSGNAPSILSSKDFAATMPVWAEMNARIEADGKMASRLGWVRDMYGFSIASKRAGVTLDVDESLMLQPPNSLKRSDAPIFHYTWGAIISDRNGNEVWRWDKREYTAGQYAPGPRKLERMPAPPAWDASKGYKLQDGKVVKEEQLGLIAQLIELFNQAVATLPAVPDGFDGDLEAARRAALPGRHAKDEAARRMTVVNRERDAKRPEAPDVVSQRLVEKMDQLL